MTTNLPDGPDEAALARRVLQDCRFLLSHEMRNPLMVMEGFAQQLLEQHGDALGARGARHMGHMLAGARKLSAQVNAMLALLDALRAPLQPEPVDFSALATQVAAALQAGEPGRDCRIEVAPGLACAADPALLRLALESLLANAWKFTSKVAGARIRVGCEVPASPGGPAVFFVADNGAGFDMALARQLFTTFHRLHPEHEFPGQGVGLALARLVVERHGGRIWAEAAPGQGACLRFTLG